MRLRRLPRRPAFRAVVLAIVLPTPLLVAAELEDRPPPLAVTVQGQVVVVDHASTLGDAIRELSLRPRDGRLLDVEGVVLDPAAEPGEILLNGVEAPRATRLADGDVVLVQHGTDRLEGTRRVMEQVSGRHLGNPMSTLATSRLLRISTVGRISDKVVEVRYRQIGGIHRPRAVALTFDDGPWPNGTLRVLEILQRMEAEATFFMVGYLIERYPGIVRRVERAGMAIGTHSWVHPWRTPFVDLTSHRIRTEIERPATLLRERFGIDPTLFRAPGGSVDAYVVRTAREAGMRVVHWSVDPSDYRDGLSPSAIASSVLRSVRPGSIVLLHDGGGSQEATIRALPRIIRGIRRMGLELVAIRDRA